jgi:hypothetical protein
MPDNLKPAGGVGVRYTLAKKNHVNFCVDYHSLVSKAVPRMVAPAIDVLQSPNGDAFSDGAA